MTELSDYILNEIELLCIKYAKLYVSSSELEEKQEDYLTQLEKIKRLLESHLPKYNQYKGKEGL